MFKMKIIFLKIYYTSYHILKEYIFYIYGLYLLLINKIFNRRYNPMKYNN